MVGKILMSTGDDELVFFTPFLAHFEHAELRAKARTVCRVWNMIFDIIKYHRSAHIFFPWLNEEITPSQFFTFSFFTELATFDAMHACFFFQLMKLHGFLAILLYFIKLWGKVSFFLISNSSPLFIFSAAINFQLNLFFLTFTPIFSPFEYFIAWVLFSCNMPVQTSIRINLVFLLKNRNKSVSE